MHVFLRRNSESALGPVAVSYVASLEHVVIANSFARSVGRIEDV
jgi:hypothetical protein